MKFKLKPNPTFKAKVEIHIPGEASPGVIVFDFKHKNRDELSELFGEAGKDLTDEELIMRIAANWDVEDTPFSAEAITGFLQDHHSAGNAVVRTYLDELKGARRGN